MIRNYLKVAWRQLLRHPKYTLINILGLALGMAVCLIVALYLYGEWSHDRWYPDSERIYRINGAFVEEGETNVTPVTPWPLADMVREELPEAEAVARLQNVWWQEVLLKHEDREFYSDNIALVDSSFFRVFAFPVLEGDVDAALKTPDHIVLSKKLARLFFGDAPAVGEVVTYGKDRLFTVAAVLDAPAGPSHFWFDAYIPFRKADFDDQEWVSMFNYRTYVKLRPGADADRFIAKVNRVYQTALGAVLYARGVDDLNGAEARSFRAVQMSFIPVQDIHTESALDGELKPGIDRRLLAALALTALVILLVACINFMNLATARSAYRAREVGIRKVAGAGRRAASGQFLVEALLQTGIAFVIALLLAEVAGPPFNRLIGSEAGLIQLRVLPGMLVIAFCFALAVGLLSGTYPALFLSAFKPVDVLNGNFSHSKRGAALRKGLVVTQFCTCTALLVFLFTVVRQINFMHEKELGFQPEQVVVAPFQTNAGVENFSALRNELLRHPGIRNVSLTERLPGESLGGNEYTFGGQTRLLDFLLVDEHYLDAMGLQLKEGAFFTAAQLRDSVRQLVVNDQFVRAFGISGDPVGQQVSIGGTLAPIIGVVEDFHWRGFTETIEPIVLQEYDAYYGKAVMRIAPAQLSETLRAIEQIWSRFEPDYPVRYTFLSEDFARLYQRYIDFGVLLGYLTALVLFTALLGLLGLAAFSAEQRTKEIGIRKVLGADIAGLVGLLSVDFLKPVFWAILLAIPIAWYAGKHWLEEFAYRTELSWWIFAGAGALALFIAFAAVSIQSLRVATANPVESLRRE